MSTSPRKREAAPATPEQVREIIAAAKAEDHVIVLPYGLAPAPALEESASEPIDLGDFNARLRGMKIIANKDLVLDVARKAQRLGDPAVDNAEKLGLATDFLEASLLGWNLTARNPATGLVEPLPQPYEGGVKRLPASLLVPMIEAINKALEPDPNS